MFVNTFLKTPAMNNTVPIPIDNINSFTLSHGVFDDLYVSKKIYTTWDGSIPTTWELSTYLRAMFRDDLYGGNVNYTSDIVKSIRIKKREAGTFEWKTIFEKPVTCNEDLRTVFIDPLNSSGVELEYAYVPVLNGSEGKMSINTVFSEFDGIFLVEKDKAFHLILDMSNEYQLNKETSVVTTIGAKYPRVIENANTRYYSGTLKGSFIEQNGGDFDTDNGYKYRKLVDDFLSDGRPKLLKDFEGKKWMVSIVDNISLDHSGHYKHPLHTINWVEIGDADDVGDLYDNGFINTDVDRR